MSQVVLLIDGLVTPGTRPPAATVATSTVDGDATVHRSESDVSLRRTAADVQFRRVTADVEVS